MVCSLFAICSFTKKHAGPGLALAAVAWLAGHIGPKGGCRNTNRAPMQAQPTAHLDSANGRYETTRTPGPLADRARRRTATISSRLHAIAPRAMARRRSYAVRS